MDSAESQQGKHLRARKCEEIDPLVRFLRAERPGRQRSSLQAPNPADIAYAKLLEGLVSEAEQSREVISRYEASHETTGSSLEIMQQIRNKLYDMIKPVRNDFVQSRQYQGNPSDIPPSERVLPAENSAEAQSSRR